MFGRDAMIHEFALFIVCYYEIIVSIYVRVFVVYMLVFIGFYLHVLRNLHYSSSNLITPSLFFAQLIYEISLDVPLFWRKVGFRHTSHPFSYVDLLMLDDSKGLHCSLKA